MNKPDFPLMIAEWLQEQMGEQAIVLHEDSMEPFGADDAAEVFTITLPSRHLDRLCLLNGKSGMVVGKACGIRLRLVEAVDVLTCTGGTAGRQFVVHAREQR